MSVLRGPRRRVLQESVAVDHGHLWRPVEVGQRRAADRVVDLVQGRLALRVDRDRVRRQLIAVVIVDPVRVVQVDRILVEALVVGHAQVGSRSIIRLRHCWEAVERRVAMLGPGSRSDSRENRVKVKKTAPDRGCLFLSFDGE